MAAYGTHAGDILLWKCATPGYESSPMIKGIGMGYGCITEMRFHPHRHNLIYTTSVDGKFSLQDFEGRHSDVCLDTMTLDYWWCSVDFSVEHGVILVGDNKGSAVLLSLDDHSVVRKYRHLHKSKIKHIEFCPARSWMLVTASVDRTIKFWDIRMLRSHSDGKPQPLSTAEHMGLVSSAYFDPICGTRLLTTSQNGEIRVYESHDLWQQPVKIISHDHRNFQHMTDIKATWHPLYNDLCVVGRYPKKGDPDGTRTVDLIDLNSGNRCGTFYSPSLGGLIQLNQFNKLGDSLASAMGYHGLIWKPPGEPNIFLQHVQEFCDNLEVGSGVALGDGTSSRRRSSRESRGNDGGGEKKSKLGDKKKLKSTVNEKVRSKVKLHH